MVKNSLIMALGISVGKIVISLLATFAIVFFRFPLRGFCFWTIFITLMLPVEVRIMPTYKVISDLGLLDSYAGLILPMIVSATAVFLFRQFFLSVPREMAEAAQIDGAGPMQFFARVLVPMSRTPIAAMFVIQFIYGWNQYLWPPADHHQGAVLHAADRHQPHAGGQRRPGGVAGGDGHHPAGHAPAGGGGDRHAALVHRRHDRDGKVGPRRYFRLARLVVGMENTST
jgi:hypothetical protein